MARTPRDATTLPPVLPLSARGPSFRGSGSQRSAYGGAASGSGTVPLSARGIQGHPSRQATLRNPPPAPCAGTQSAAVVRCGEDADLGPRVVELLNLSQFTHQIDSVVPLGTPLFKPMPPVIQFTDFEALQHFDVTLSLRNLDNVARRVKIVPPDSAYFHVIPGKGRRTPGTTNAGTGGSAGDKVAPGMEVTYTIRFSPKTQSNYSYDLMVVTEREKFTIPVRAAGASAKLELPADLEFGSTPVKYKSTKTVLVRNVGEKPTKFLVRTSPPFTTSVKDGYLGVREFVQLDIHFNPDRSQAYQGEMVFLYGDRTESRVILRGVAENVDVGLSQESVTMGGTFVALSTQHTIIMHNNSEVPVDFGWRAFPTIDDEVEQKLHLHRQLRHEEDGISNPLNSRPHESDSEYSTSDEEERHRAKRMENKAIGTLQRRHHLVEKSIMEDPMLFYDEIFAIEPLTGRIWPKSQHAITITFSPKDALKYRCAAYCSVVGQSGRVPLLLQGQGIGPKAAFSYCELEVGDVFVESVHEYEVDLINHGEIAVNFRLVPNLSPFGATFRFDPSSGRLEVGEQRSIIVTLRPDLLGEFNETFHWELECCACRIPLTFRGKSVSPTFTFDVDQICFGTVSYGFLNSKTITLTNMSEVAMRFALRIPGDERQAQKEFDVIPTKGKLLPNCVQKVQIDFTSVNLKAYDLCLIVDLDGVGQELASIPISATCTVPEITFDPAGKVDFGDVFIRYPSHQPLVLRNASALPAKFEVVQQGERMRNVVAFEPDQTQGFVPPFSSHAITVTVIPRTTGAFQTSMFVRILGESVMQQTVLIGNAVGPTVSAEASVLDWGDAKCLAPTTKELRVTNTCVIAASVRCFMKTKGSLWVVEPKSLELAPRATATVRLTLTIDETTKISDLLHLVVAEGRDTSVSLKAKGVGTPVTCQESLRRIDFGTQYTTQTITREFVIENRGSKPRKLVWDRKDAPSKKNAAGEEAPSIFSIFPDSVQLEGKCACKFQFMANCPKPGQMTEEFVCLEFVGNDRKGRKVFLSELGAVSVKPLLEFSQPTVRFKYIWRENEAITPMQETIQVTNISPLDLRFNAKAPFPFSIGVDAFALGSGDSADICVEFDPSYNSERNCAVMKKKLTITYPEHPQKDHVVLEGETVFPNVVLSADKIDFGPVLYDTTKTVSITMKNEQELPVSYQWAFVEEEVADCGTPSEPCTEARSVSTVLGDALASIAGLADVAERSMDGSATTGALIVQGKSDSINQIFDILPIMGRLDPGCSATTSFTYFGLSADRAQATAVCQIDGGPDYEVSLEGQAAHVEYSIDHSELDFGAAVYNEVLHNEIILTNNGKLAYHFGFNLMRMTRPFVIDAFPFSGLLQPGQKQKITIKFRAGIPDSVTEVALLEIAHFEPHALTVRGRGVFPGVLLSTIGPDGDMQPLPRVHEGEHQERLGVARGRLLECRRTHAAGASEDVEATMESTVAESVESKDEILRVPLPGPGCWTQAEPTQLSGDEVEHEADRLYLCQVLQETERELAQQKEAAISAATAPLSATAKAGIGTRLLKALPAVTAAQYVCDFGMSIPGRDCRRVISVLNCYKEPISFTIDKKLLAAHGFTVKPDKWRQLPAGESQRLEFTSSGPKDGAEGRQDLDWFLPIKDGPRYQIRFMSGFVQPALELSSESIDFSHVPVGQVKRIVISLKNARAVPVEWAYLAPRNQSGKKMPSVYTLSPDKGCLSPGDKALVTVSFTPPAANVFRSNINLRIRGNPKRRLLQAQGTGVQLRVELEPSSALQLGPVLPDSAEHTQEFVLHNPTMYPIEVYSVDYDEKYLLEEAMLMDFDGYDASGTAELPVRLPGEKTWDRVVKRTEKLRKQRALKERGRKWRPAGVWRRMAVKLIDIAAEELIRDARAQAKRSPRGEDAAHDHGSRRTASPSDVKQQDEEDEDEEDDDEDEEDEEQSGVMEMDPSDYPVRVPPEDRLNAIIFGPPACGKTTVAQSVAAKDGRRVLTLDDIVAWALSGPTSLRCEQEQVRRARLHELIQRQEREHEEREDAREKECKRSRQPFDRRPIEHYSLPDEDLVHYIRKRSELPDCNAGIIFDGFGSKYFATLAKGVELIFSALQENFAVLGISMLGHFGLGAQPRNLGCGHLLPTMADPAAQDDDVFLSSYAQAVKEHHLELQQCFTGRAQAMQDELDQLKEALAPASTPRSEPRTVRAGEEANAMEAMAQTQEVEKQRLDLQASLAECNAFLARLEEVASSSAKQPLAVDLHMMLHELEAVASSTRARRMEDAAEQSRRAATSDQARQHGARREVPPDGQDEGRRPADESPFTFVPLPFSSGVIDGCFFQPLGDAAVAALPAPMIPAEPPLPPPSCAQLVSRPRPRPQRKPAEHFSLASQDTHTGESRTRWIIEPGGRQQMQLKYASSETGTFTAQLGFEVVGASNSFVALGATGVTALPGINSDPRNVFMRRAKAKPASGYASKQYIASLGLFDFGPLLVGRDPKLPTSPSGQLADLDPFVRQHVEYFRITNNSAFAAQVSFHLRDPVGDDDPGPSVAKQSDRRSGAPLQAKPARPFLFDPEQLELGIDETKEVRVACFPAQEGTYNATLVATVQHNPQPVEFPICAIGSVPNVSLESSVVDFDRMLLQQHDSKPLRLANICAVPVKWQLLPARGSTIPPAFTIQLLEGKLAVGEERSIMVTFRAETPGVFEFSLQLQVADVEGLKPLQDASVIEIRAEAFTVDVVPEFPGSARGLDFAAVRVGCTEERSFRISNNGKYAVHYEVNVQNRVLRDMLDFVNAGGDGRAVLQPAEKQTVRVRFTPTQEMQSPELSGTNRHDEIELLVSEAHGGQHVDVPPFPVTFRAMHNTFSLTPPRGLSFGPALLGESQTRDFEIYNDGLFRFDWAVIDPSVRPPSQPALSQSREKPAKPDSLPDFALGPFAVRPAQGSLSPGETAKVQVKFAATEDKSFDCKIGVHVDGAQEYPGPGRKTAALDQSRDLTLTASAHGVSAAGTRMYCLTAQSCTPGIDTQNIPTIFEEHFVARSLEDAIATAGRVDIRAFCEDDRTFSFGPVLVSGPSDGLEAARFRVSNPKMVPCDVQFDIKARGGVKKVQPFELSAKELHIPPQEYRYIKVRFRPPSLSTYSATFEASVRDGRDPDTNMLRFELVGDGVVPTVTLDGPPLSGENGGELSFGQLKVGQAHRADFVLRNDGHIPATARCEVQTSPHFSAECAKSVVLEPGAQSPLQLCFHPQASGGHVTSVRVHTLHNQFEDTTITLVGKGYVDPVAWVLPAEGEPGAARRSGDDAQAWLPLPPDHVHLGDVVVGSESSFVFHISNSAEVPIRFRFPETLPAPFPGCLRMSPSVGHVLPKSRKAISCTFAPPGPLRAAGVLVPVAVASIECEGEPEDWDDTTRAYRTPRSARAATPERPEPAHRVLAGTQRDMPLFVSALADSVSYTCGTQEIRFAPTVMFRSRVHRFCVTNTCTMGIPFAWSFRPLRPDGAERLPMPYTITPRRGSIEAGGSQEFSVRFAPVEVENFDTVLESNMPSDSGSGKPLSLQLSATATRPWCHFELDASNDRSRRHSGNPVDPNLQILEFESLGTWVKNTKRFYVLNPTSVRYDFAWTRQGLDPLSETSEEFRCLTKRGTILSGKKYEMVFEYVPASVGTHESQWAFNVLSQDAAQSFLLVGTVKEPRAGMDRPSISFGRILRGGKARETVHVVNKEHMPFSFTIDASSYAAEGQEPVLVVSPTSGVVGPGASFPVEVTFRPSEEKFYNFNVVCNIKRRVQPVLLNVKGEGYRVHTKLVLGGGNREDRILTPGVQEFLDFGSLQVQETRTVKLRLSTPNFSNARPAALDDQDDRPNMSFDFLWQVRPRGSAFVAPVHGAPPYISVSPWQGVATPEEETVITVDYRPDGEHDLDGTLLRMLIPSGPGDSSYTLALTGRARRPSVDFSVLKHDFGPCFVARRGVMSAGEPILGGGLLGNSTPYERLDIVVRNRDTSDCWLATTFQNTPYLEVQLPASMIEAGRSLTVPVIFSPKDCVEYREQIEFVVNDSVRQYVSVSGTGCEVKLGVVAPAMQSVDFGIAVGKQALTRTVRLVSRSLKPVEFSLSDPDGQLADRGVQWQPAGAITLRPKEQVPLDLRFLPQHRVAPFKLPMRAVCSFGDEVHLLTLSGSCHTAEVRLSEHSVLFGDVMFQSCATRTLRLQNHGDLAVKYRTEMPAKGLGHFSVDPADGLVAPHGDVTLQVKFHPRRPSTSADERGGGEQNKSRKIRFVLDPNYQHEPVELIVQGRGIEQPESTVRSLQFVSEVRERTVQVFAFPPEPLPKSATATPWKLKPVISTESPAGVEYWFCPQEILVPPGGQCQVEVTYRPLTMTLREEDRAAVEDAGTSPRRKRRPPFPEKHQGRILISTPDGNAFCYKLEGTATPQKAMTRIAAEVPCKTPHEQAVELSNWLPEAQRFNVELKLLEPASATAQEEVRIQGAGTFDLPPGAAKGYKFNVYAYREGSALVQLVFRNPRTDEFQVFGVAFRFVAAERIQTLEFSAMCRQTAVRSIAVANPLSVPASFKCESGHASIQIQPTEFTVNAKSEASVDVLFRPAIAASGETSVRLRSQELGDYPYSVVYQAKPAGLEKTIIFKAPLGSRDTVQSFKFLHVARNASTYTSRIEAAPGRRAPANDFVVETADISAAAPQAGEAGVELSVDIRFEPSRLEESQAMLVLSSPTGGEYKALLVGYALEPRPLGPISVSAGQRAGQIEFFNPFDEAVDFSVQVDKPTFAVGSKILRLEPKKSGQIKVEFKGAAADTGRLLVSAPNVSKPWIYFLKGSV